MYFAIYLISIKYKGGGVLIAIRNKYTKNDFSSQIISNDFEGENIFINISHIDPKTRKNQILSLDHHTYLEVIITNR